MNIKRDQYCRLNMTQQRTPAQTDEMEDLERKLIAETHAWAEAIWKKLNDPETPDRSK